MFFNETVYRQIRENIGAIDNKKFVSDFALDILNAAPRFKKFRLMYQREWYGPVLGIGEFLNKFFRQMVSIYHERFDAGVAEMI
jgi:hypothetical protein